MINDRNIIYIGDIVSNFHHAGNKARADVEKVFRKAFGQAYLILTGTSAKTLKYNFCYFIRYMTKFYSLLKQKSKIILIQYPFDVHPFLSVFLLMLLKRHKFILLVHDIPEWRFPEIKRTLCSQSFLYNAEAVIVHNSKMLARIEGWDIEAKLINLEIFDYLRDSDEHPARVFSHTVAFAGNLAKSTFLHENLSNLFGKLYLYGPGEEHIQFDDQIVYKGSFSPSEIPSKLEGSFGLIWDGELIDTSSGNLGEYTKYNNPHKLSLYISSCLPVIVWSKAAIADFVKKYNIGFCVDSLYEIEEKLSSMTDEDYEVYLRNLRDLQHKVINGYFTKQAIKSALEWCKS